MRTTWIVGLFLVLNAASGCSDDAGAARAELTWIVRCDDGGVACPPYVEHTVMHVNGEDGHRISCSLSSAADVRVLSFSVFKGTEYGIEVTNASFLPGGGPVVGLGCNVTVQEDNDYKGLCGGAINTNTPCRLTINPVGDGVQGEFQCGRLPQEANQTITRAVLAPGGGVAPVTFAFSNCS
jgi:hypothetical protein